MPHTRHLRIADVEFVIRSEAPLGLNDPAGAYAGFMGAGREARGGTLVHRVSVSLRRPPSLKNMPLVFSAGAWSLHQRAGSRYLVAHERRTAAPYWVCRVAPDLTHATVWCARRDRRADVRNPVCYPLDQLLLMYALSGRGGLLVHSAGAVVEGTGFILAGRSGAGKSTISRLIGQEAAGRLLSDDRMIVRRQGHRWAMFGTPWPGDAGIAVNRSAPLGAILFLRHAPRNTVRRLSPSEALERLLPVTSVPWYDAPVLEKVLGTCEALISGVPAYDFCFAPARGAVRALSALAEELSAPQPGRRRSSAGPAVRRTSRRITRQASRNGRSA